MGSFSPSSVPQTPKASAKQRSVSAQQVNGCPGCLLLTPGWPSRRLPERSETLPIEGMWRLDWQRSAVTGSSKAAPVRVLLGAGVPRLPRKGRASPRHPAVSRACAHAWHGIRKDRARRGCKRPRGAVLLAPWRQGSSHGPFSFQTTTATGVSFGTPGPALRADEPPLLGQGSGLSPVQLLAAAVGNCLSASLRFALRKFKQAPEPLSCTVRPVGRLPSWSRFVRP